MATSIDLFDLADQIALVSSQVLMFRIKSEATGANALALVQLERQLDELVNSLRNRGVIALGEELAANTGKIATAIKGAKAELAKIEKVKEAIGIATAVIGIAQSLLMLNFPQAIQQSIALIDALDD